VDEGGIERVNRRVFDFTAGIAVMKKSSLRCISRQTVSVSRVGVEVAKGSGEVRMSGLNKREQSLVALGAALASNCVPCVEYHIPGARRAGLSDIEINHAIEIADKVRQVPARAVLETALARIDSSPEGATDTATPGCGCSGSSGSPEIGRMS
jgi:4-carboxymuconolactone decarboxylase